MNLNQTREDYKQVKEDINKIKDELNKANEEANIANEKANKIKDDINKIKEDLDKTKEDLNKTKEDLGKENYNKNNKNKEDDKNKKDNNKNKDNNENQKFYTPKTYGERQIEISFDYDEAIRDQLNKKLNYSKINSFPKDKLKFAICAIGKLENLIARDFVLYHLELGVDKIYIYDNNEIDGEKFEDVLQDLIDEKFVEIIDMRGKKKVLHKELLMKIVIIVILMNMIGFFYLILMNFYILKIIL